MHRLTLPVTVTAVLLSGAVLAGPVQPSDARSVLEGLSTFQAKMASSRMETRFIAGAGQSNEGSASASPSKSENGAAPRAEPEASAPTGYGVSPEDPIKVGGGPAGEREFLDRLRGPEGQRVRYKRLRSCCHFKTESSPHFGGLLDIYEVTYDGLPAPVRLYLNMYDRELPQAPAGFRLD